MQTSYQQVLLPSLNVTQIQRQETKHGKCQMCSFRPPHGLMLATTLM